MYLLIVYRKKKQIMSIIRYRFKADKNFESVKIDGMNCSLGELKRLIAAKSSRSGTYHPKDDYDLFISNANTHEGLLKNLFYLFLFIFIFRIQR